MTSKEVSRSGKALPRGSHPAPACASLDRHYESNQTGKKGKFSISYQPGWLGLESWPVIKEPTRPLWDRNRWMVIHHFIPFLNEYNKHLGTSHYLFFFEVTLILLDSSTELVKITMPCKQENGGIKKNKIGIHYGGFLSTFKFPLPDPIQHELLNCMWRYGASILASSGWCIYLYPIFIDASSWPCESISQSIFGNLSLHRLL